MISNADPEVKLLFIEEQLEKHGQWLCDIFLESIANKNKNVFTGALLESVNYSLFKDKGRPGLRFNFLNYGRFIDISAYKKNRVGFDVKEVVWGERVNRRKRKRTKWYAENMYSGFYRLVSSIMYGLSEAEIARLKGIIENRKNSKI